MSQLIVLIGPDRRGIGGIESVIGAYEILGVPGYEFEYLTTWNKTVTTNRRYGQSLRAVWSLFSHARTWRARRAYFYVHFSHKGSFVREGFFLLAGRLLRLPTFATVHGSSFVTTASQSWLWRRLYGTVLACADQVSVLNEETRDAVSSMGIKTPIVMDNPGGVHLASSPPAAGEAAPIALFAGAVGRRKGVDILLEAWSGVAHRVPDAQLLIVGPAGDVDVVRAAGSYWCGPLEPSALAELLSSARVAVLPSRAEAMPMFLIEAMGWGRPLVVTDVGAMAKQALGCGIVVDANDTSALTDALTTYLSNSALATQHGSRAYEKYVDTYGPKAVKQNLDTFFSMKTTSNNGRI